MKWLCIKDVVMDNDGHRTFTEGKVYEGELLIVERPYHYISLINDDSEEHFGSVQWLFKHFKRICPECEQTNVQFGRSDYLCDNCVLNNLEMEL